MSTAHARNTHPPASGPAEVGGSWSALLDDLHLTETRLTELVDALQKEREAVAIFDIDVLLEVVVAKHQMVQTLFASRPARMRMLTRHWHQVCRARLMPDDTIATIRTLAERVDDTAISAALGDLCDRLQPLLDVVQELTDANRILVQRALSWVDAHLAELQGTEHTTYSAKGRLEAHTGTAKRRTL